MALPKPELEPLLQPQKRFRRYWRPFGLMVVGVLALTGAWAALPASSGDPALSPGAQQVRIKAMADAGALVLPAVTPVERPAAVQGMRLPDTAQRQLEQDLVRQRSELVWLTFWDDQVEDGDIVEVESQGFRQQVTITHAPVQVALPKPTNGAILLRGIRDGGGGITVAVRNGGMAVPMPVMAPGQVLVLSVAP